LHIISVLEFYYQKVFNDIKAIIGFNGTVLLFFFSFCLIGLIPFVVKFYFDINLSSLSLIFYLILSPFMGIIFKEFNK